MGSTEHSETGTLLPVLGKITAGLPVFSEQVPLGEVHWNHAPEREKEKYFALQITGDSMIEDGLYDGAYVVVRHGSDFYNGDIVIAYVNEEPTVKRIYRRGNSMVLQPANSAYEPLEINPRFTPFRIGGKVVDLIRP